MGQNQNTNQPAPAGDAKGRSGSRRPGVWFVVIFLGILGGFYVFSQLRVFDEVIAPASLRVSAVASGPILNLLGEQAVVTGTRLASARGHVDVSFGCDALEPIVYFAAAVLAFPARWRRRLVGLVIGVPALFALNILRIVTLYYVATRAPGWFDAAHVDVGQPIFIVLTLGLWFAWVMLLSDIRRKPPSPSPQATPAPASR